MGSPTEDRKKAAELPEGDVIRILLEQHARIRELFGQVQRATGQAKEEKFGELRRLLAVHETAEELVLRPVTTDIAGRDVAEARNKEEATANQVLADLEKLDVTDPTFDSRLAGFEQAVDAHAEAEEAEEFPRILAACDEDQRRGMGTLVLAAEAVAPTHPHPSTAGSHVKQLAFGPFASIVDRTRDAIEKARKARSAR